MIGPHAVVDSEVTLGGGVTLGPHAVLSGHTTIGANAVLHAGVAIGGPAQDFGYGGEEVSVEIGEGCTLREHVTVHAGTAAGRRKTVVGAGSYLMAGSHVGHDCQLGERVVLSNNVLLAGHCSLGSDVSIGGGAAIVQRVRIGSHAFVSGLSGVTKDVVPYAYVIGHRGRLDGLNLVGLQRRGFDRAAIRTLRAAFGVLFDGEGLFADRMAQLRGMAEAPGVAAILAFIDEAPHRPLLQPLARATGAGNTPDFLEAGR